MSEELKNTVEDRYRGEAQASESQKAAVGGEKTLAIKNDFFQSDEGAQEMAEKLLQRLQNRKGYFSATSEFCPLPIELDDTLTAQERIKDPAYAAEFYGDENKKYGDSSRLYRFNGIVLVHTGIVRDIKLSVTPKKQSLTFTLGVDDD